MCCFFSLMRVNFTHIYQCHCTDTGRILCACEMTLENVQIHEVIRKPWWTGSSSAHVEACGMFVTKAVSETVEIYIIADIPKLKCPVDIISGVNKFSRKICSWSHVSDFAARINLCIRPANERRRYSVTSSLIGWAHTQNYLCCHNRDLGWITLLTLLRLWYLGTYVRENSSWLRVGFRTSQSWSACLIIMNTNNQDTPRYINKNNF